MKKPFDIEQLLAAVLKGAHVTALNCLPFKKL